MSSSARDAAPAFSRRAVLFGTVAAATAPAELARGAPPPIEYHLTLDRARLPLVGSLYPWTEVWAYNGSVPGPEIRCRQGDRLRVTVENRLAEETTVHWHGVRVPNAMDGVPYLTQPPIAPGTSFTYEFDAPDAGTYWYHPHTRSFEQVGRGLYGALIVEEPTPLPVDRDVAWVLGDWRLQPDAAIREDFGNMMDVSHNGRVGNTVTINGRVPGTFGARSGERLRLRLINAASARIFALDFQGLAPIVVALDGQPVEPHAPEGGRILVAPAQRVDLLLDMTGEPGTRISVLDSFYDGLGYRLVDFAYADEASPRPAAGRPLAALPANPVAEPDLASAERHRVVLGGGMMGGMGQGGMGGMMGGGMMGGMGQGGMGGMMGGGMGAMMRNGLAWTMNGVAATGHVHEPMVTLVRGRSYLLDLVNDTAWHHPIHLHGHVFRVLSRDGRPVARPEWRDTVLLAPRERAEIALVADNPGDWMIHCHILEHQAGGMAGVFRVV